MKLLRRYPASTVYLVVVVTLLLFLQLLESTGVLP